MFHLRFAQLTAYRAIDVPEYKSAYLLVLLVKDLQPSAKFSPIRPLLIQLPILNLFTQAISK